MYAIPRHNPISVLGMLTKGQKCSDLSPSMPAGPSPLRGATYASALLDKVVCIWVFRDRQTNFCQGLLVEYINGSQRALGCCRLGIDPAERYAGVASVAFAAIEWRREDAVPRRVVKAKLYPMAEDDNALDESWMLCSKGSTLEVWKTSTEMVIKL